MRQSYNIYSSLQAGTLRGNCDKPRSTAQIISAEFTTLADGRAAADRLMQRVSVDDTTIDTAWIAPFYDIVKQIIDQQKYADYFNGGQWTS